MRGLGYLPDPQKQVAEDWSATELLGAGSIAREASARHLVTDIFDQGALGSCTANAAMQAVHASHLKQGAPAETPYGSRLFAYYFARATHHETANDSGTWLRAVFECLNKFGFCPESLWPYEDGNPGRFQRVPNMAAVRAAFDQHAPTQYRRIYETGYERVEVIKRAIMAQHLVCFGTQVTQAFCDDRGANNGNPIDPPANGAPLAGGHAMCVGEYTEKDAGIVNSWGRGFGQDGWFRMSWDYIVWNRTADLWIVESAPRFSEVP